jgi:hypothetical protein
MTAANLAGMSAERGIATRSAKDRFSGSIDRSQHSRCLTQRIMAADAGPARAAAQA